MKCGFDIKKIYQYFDGELPEKESAELMEHISVCLDCDALFHEVKDMIDDVRLLSRDMPDTALALAFKKVRSEKKRTQAKKLSFVLAAAACLVMAVTFLLRTVNPGGAFLYNAKGIQESCLEEAGEDSLGYGETFGTECTLPPAAGAPDDGRNEDRSAEKALAPEEEGNCGIYLTQEEYASFKELLSLRMGAENAANAVTASENGSFILPLDGARESVKTVLEEMFGGDYSGISDYSTLHIYIVS